MLGDYTLASMSAAQRRFLMRRLRQTTGDESLCPTLEAEELAAAYLESRLPAWPLSHRLEPTASSPAAASTAA